MAARIVTLKEFLLGYRSRPEEDIERERQAFLRSSGLPEMAVIVEGDEENTQEDLFEETAKEAHAS